MQSFCPNCGNQMHAAQTVCAQCGNPQSANVQQQNQNQMIQETGIQWGWVVLGFFVPIVGWILWGMWKEKKPQTAKACGIAGFIGFAVNLFLIVPNL